MCPDFHSDHTNLLCHQECIEIFFHLSSCLTLLLFLFLMPTCLAGVKKHLNVILICDAQLVNDAKHIFSCVYWSRFFFLLVGQLWDYLTQCWRQISGVFPWGWYKPEYQSKEALLSEGIRFAARLKLKHLTVPNKADDQSWSSCFDHCSLTGEQQPSDSSGIHCLRENIPIDPPLTLWPHSLLLSLLSHQQLFQGVYQMDSDLHSRNAFWKFPHHILISIELTL